jgi:L-amino acid N-acyltransferase YncA
MCLHPGFQITGLIYGRSMFSIRQAEENAHAYQISEIYNHYILHTKITFETEAVSIEEMAERIRGKIS